MSRVLVIDNEAKSVEEMKKTLLNLDAQCAIEVYPSFEKFEAVAQAAAPEFFQFNIVIFEYQQLKFNEWDAKLTELKTKFPASTRICITTYDNPAVNRKHILNLHIFNLLYKPYDPLILKESLNIALKASGDPKDEIKPLEMKAQASSAYVGILKEIDIVSICELGFVTHNDSSIPLDSFSKYYGKVFSYQKKQSVWAKCIQSDPAPDQPGLFINKFHFVGIESPVLMKLRSHVQMNKAQRIKNPVWSFANAPTTRKISIAVLDVPESTGNHFKQDIEDHFNNVTVDVIVFDANKKAEPLTYDCVINLNPTLTYKTYESAFQPGAIHVLFSDKIITDEQFKELLPTYKDIFRLPLDKAYFYKKLKTIIPDLQCKEIPEIVNIATSEKLKAANLIKLSEICELYLIFSYHRELPKGEFREFAFIAEDENQMIQLPAFSNFSKKGSPEPGNPGPTFTHQFIFWGTTDHYLKQIRIWLLHNYIEQNQDSA